MTLIEMGHHVVGTAATANEAIDLARAFRPRLILIDVRLKGDMDGVDAVMEIRRYLDCRVIFITGSSERATVERVRTAAPDGLLFKPIMPRNIKAVIDALPSLHPGNRRPV
jgi:DNA-binding NarL/FixJ family response regulator